MSYRVRPIRSSDVDALYRMAKLTGAGFTNLPPDRDTLRQRIARSEKAFAKDTDAQEDDLFIFVAEKLNGRKRVVGTCQIFARIGSEWPFYSYRISTLTQTSKALGRLFLHPEERAAGVGMLLARSRYLFIKLHRQRFGNQVIAELRGVVDEAGSSPFWDAIGGRFFGMSFREADEFNAMQGNQFIADLMPKTSIYTAMLPESARSVIGVPHLSGRAAMKMLEREGFRYDCYVDIFDGGPTVAARTDSIRTISQSRSFVVTGTSEDIGTDPQLLASGHLTGFAACYGRISPAADGSATIDPESARLLGLSPGATVLATER
jgi:arginine N-succinyltransferase